jgi:glycerol-3-phosphate acyltransferase PlsX
MKLLLDTLGGDNSSLEFVRGAIEVLDELEESTQVILLGKEEEIKKNIEEICNKKIEDFGERLQIINSNSVITNHDHPTEAIKTKKDSSMCIGFDMLKNNKADALVSAGNTGALLAGGLLIVGRIKGIDRPALCPMLPTLDGKGFILLDAGANTNCKPINYVQFAKMGSIYAEKVYSMSNAPVALLSIGAEKEKGTPVIKEVYSILEADKTINFYGNIEARDMFTGNVRVVVTDGFSGNIALKTAEGIGVTIISLIKEEFTASLPRKVGAGILKATGAIGSFKKRFDYSEYGGALLLGIEKPIIKFHGTGKAKDVKIVLKQAENFVKNDVVGEIKNKISSNEI